MRILIVSPYNWNRPGGVKSHITDTAKSLVKLGHSVVVLSPVEGNPELPNGWERISRYESIPKQGALLALNAGKTIEFGGTQIDVTWLDSDLKESLKGFLKSFDPSVIHFHTPWTPFMSVQLLQIASELQKDGLINARYVATFHDTPSESGFGKFLGKTLMPIAARYFMPLFDEVIAVSAPQSRFLTRFSNKNVHVIPNGIYPPDLSDLKRIGSSWKSQQPYILFLGRLEHRKGLMDAIEVFRRLKATHDNLKFVIAGEGPLRKKAENTITEYGLEQVYFTGQLADTEKWEAMHHATLYLAPALYGESFGIVLLEAMSVGTPVVGYANSGYKSVISGHFDELFVEPGEIEKLVNAASELLDNKSELDDIRHKGLTFSENFNWRAIIQKIIPLYEGSSY